MRSAYLALTDRNQMNLHESKLPTRQGSLKDSLIFKVIMAVLIVLALVAVSGLIALSNGSDGISPTDKDTSWLVPVIVGTAS